MVLASGFTLAVLLAAGPSFDCSHAANATEKAICQHPALSQLDTELAAAYAAALQRAPAARAAIVEGQRAWLRWRNRACGAEQRCLAAWHRKRIAEVQEATYGTTLPLCRSFIRHYESALASPGLGSRGLPQPEEILAAGLPDLQLSRPVAQLADGSKASFASWGKMLSPPLVFDRELFEPLPSRSTTIRIDQLPGERWFAASYTEGTASCIFSAFFKDVDGRATPAEGPPNWTSSEPGSSCQVSRAFGAVDGVPVALEFGSDRAGLGSTVTLSPWTGGHFGTSCQMVFSYGIRYSAPSPTGYRGAPWNESCDAKDCERFRSSAFQVVLAAQGNRNATDNMPVTTKKIVDGVRYRVSAGRVTIGWRIFGDWRVKFVRFADGAEVASLIVEASRGDLKEAAAW